MIDDIRCRLNVNSISTSIQRTSTCHFILAYVINKCQRILRGSLMPIAASIPAVVTTKVCPNFRNDENKIFPFCAPFIPFDAEDDTFERRRRLFAIEYLMPL